MLCCVWPAWAWSWLPYCWTVGGAAPDGCDHDQELPAGAAGSVGAAACHCVAGPGIGGGAVAAAGSGGALMVGG